MRKLTWRLAIIALCAAAAYGMCEETKPRTRIVPICQEAPSPWLHVGIFYDSETGVMYMMTRRTGVTVMVGADGKPLIYKPEE